MDEKLFELVIADNFTELEGKVNEKMRAGWVPAGRMFSGTQAEVTGDTNDFIPGMVKLYVCIPMMRYQPGVVINLN